ncbi:hypothetical protein BDV18DRAFT_142777 [Aspergillus unguis]
MQSAPSQEELSLSAHLQDLHNGTLSLHATIEAVGNLLPNLTATISPTGIRLISIKRTNNDAKLTGEADLNTLGRIYLDCARRCTREHASFQTRLLHVSLEGAVGELYGASENLLSDGLKNGTVKFPPPGENDDVGCPCCRGDPDAVILFGFYQGEAFYFWEDEYKAMWGDEDEQGSSTSRDERWLMASKEQVERKLEEEKKAESKL